MVLFSVITVKAEPGEYGDSIRSYRAEDVVVTATRTPLPLKNMPVITRVITGTDIERQGIASIEELLQRELAGVEFHQAGYGTTMSFQGLDARYVLFLVDGERMAGETYGNIDYERIPMSSVERIEIVRGASSVLYGSNAMGAVVNIITKMPEEKFEITGSVRYGTRFQKNKDEVLGSWATARDLDKYHDKIDLPNVKTDLSIGVNTGKFRSLTTGTFRTADGYKLRGKRDEKRYYKEVTPMKMDLGMGVMTMPPSFTAQEPRSDTTIFVGPDSRGMAVSGLKDWSLGQKFDYRINDMFRLEASGNYFRKERYDFLTSIMDDNPVSGIMPSGDTWEYESYEGYNARFLMEHSPNGRNKVYLSYMRDGYSRDQKALGKGSTPKQKHTYNIVRLLWTSEMGRSHRVTTGLEFNNERLKFDLNKNEEKGFNDEKTLNTGALYIQDELFSGQKLSFVLGVRGDWSDKFGMRVTPRISAKYDFSDFSLRANYSNGYRMPSLKEMYMRLNIPVANSPVIEGNPDLKLETNNYISLSLDYNLDWLNASVTVSKNYFRNKIDTHRLPDLNEEGKILMRYGNNDKSDITSVEFISRVKVVKGLTVDANYIYTHRTDKTSEDATQYIFPSPHTATLGVSYSFMKKSTRFGMNVNGRYVGPKKYEDFMSYVNFSDVITDFIADIMSGNVAMPPFTDPRFAEFMAAVNKADYYYTGNYSSRHKGYAVFNASVDVDFPKWFSLTVGVDNIFDYKPKVVNFNSALIPGVNGFARVSFRF